MNPVITKVEGDIAIVTIDNPPVNAISHAVRKGLLDALHATDHPDIRAVVLICKGRTFVAGADVNEFGQPPQEPHLPDILTKIEQAPQPWIAAIHGSALGGGCELALVCSYRIAAETAKFGLPEVNLGLIPGAGGTVRLPRLIPALAALDMVASGKPVSAQKALSLGLLDKISRTDLLEDAKAFANQIKTTPRPSPLKRRGVVDVPSQEEWDTAAQKVFSRARGQNAPIEALMAVRDAIDLPANEALKNERERFLSLKNDPQSAALRHIFFAERAAPRMPRLKGVSARPIDHVGIIGGGTMGAGIAAAMLLNGLSVILIERDQKALETGLQRITDTLANSLKRGLVSKEQHSQMIAALQGSTDYGTLLTADLVIEAVFEDMNVKKEVLAKLDTVIKPDAILATNTSYLDVGELANSITDPSRLIGLHFFSPAHIMKLLEIIHHPEIADDVLATGFALAKRLRKIAVPAGVCDGFIGNRIMSAYRRECDYMLEEGALPQDIDAAMREYGFAMGIFAMQDMAGLDIAWAMRKRQAATRDPDERYVEIADQLCEAGRFGRKTGKGWYDFTADKSGKPDPEVKMLIEKASKLKGIPRAAFTSEQIMQRILDVMQAEGNKILTEGIAQSADAIDVVMVNGYSFPRWHGGPMFASN